MMTELMLIGGEPRRSSSQATLDVLNPATSAVIASVPDASPQDAAGALTIAAEARAGWARTPLHTRIAAVQRLLRVLEERRAELARIVMLETGKPLCEAEEEVDDTHAVFRGYAERVGPAMYGMATELDLQPGLPGDYLITRREPLGVVVAILPFNFPIEMYAHKVAPALLAGNCVVVKPSEETPLSALKLTEWLYESGVPGPVLQCLTGQGEIVGEALVTSPLVQAISMTGSTEVGTRIYQHGAKNLAKVSLELGGNDPLIVLADADLQCAAEMAVLGRTLCAGQCCSANKRLIVHAAVADEFTALLLQALAGVTTGDPALRSTRLGTLISRAAAERAESQVLQTVSEGAQLALGGEIDGAFFSPAVLLGVTREMNVAADMEIFAPVFPVVVSASEAEMISIANNTMYGLSASVFTRDYEKAFTFAADIECGLVVINGTSLYRPYNHQHGGYKKSGIGREGLDITIQEMTQNKGIAFRKAIRPRDGIDS